jgi:hypothetical protein
MSEATAGTVCEFVPDVAELIRTRLTDFGLQLCYCGLQPRGNEMVPATDLAKLKMADFSGRLEQVFEMQTDGGVLPLKLTKVDSYGQAIREGGAFSLLFVAPPGPWQPQAVYPIKHPELGTMEIFIVPAGPVPAGNSYHATFT